MDRFAQLLAKFHDLVEGTKALLARIDKYHEQNMTLLARIAELVADPARRRRRVAAGQALNRMSSGNSSSKSQAGTARTDIASRLRPVLVTRSIESAWQYSVRGKFRNNEENKKPILIIRP